MFRRLGLFSLSLLTCAALAAPAAANTQFDYPDFSSVSGLQLNRDARQVGNVLQLTPPEPNKIGTAFSTTPIDPQQSFETYFGISMHDGTAIRPADGMALVIQSSPQGASAISPSIGGSLGYNGITPSLAVEFDPFYNFEAPDPLFPHISINAGTTGSHVACAVVNSSATPPCNATLPFPIYGSPLYGWVEYDAATQHLKVFISQSPAKPSSPLLDHPVILGPLGNAAYIGFTASTGGNTAAHDVLNWHFGPEPGAVPVQRKKKARCPPVRRGRRRGHKAGRKAAASKAGRGKAKGRNKGKKCGRKKGHQRRGGRGRRGGKKAS